MKHAVNALLKAVMLYSAFAIHAQAGFSAAVNNRINQYKVYNMENCLIVFRKYDGGFIFSSFE